MLDQDAYLILELLYFVDLLSEDFAIVGVVLEDHFVPFAADPALHSIAPEGSLFNFIVTKDARENDLIHIASHRIFNQEVVCHLVDAHEHEG